MATIRQKGADAASSSGVILSTLCRPIGWIVVVAAVSAAASVGSAPQPAEDPDWPCQQRLVPKLTAAAYWSGTLDMQGDWSGTLDMQGDWHADPEVAELVRH